MGGGEEITHRFTMGPYRQIILFGDSITEFSANQQYFDDKGQPYTGFAFFPAVSHWFIRRFDVLNRGFSGYNTALARGVLPQFMPTPEQATVSLISIFFGANDAALEKPEPENQHVSLHQYKDNLKGMIHDPSVKAHNPRILLITPPPIDEHKLEPGAFPKSRRAAITKQYAEACVEVGKEEKVEVLDLWTAMIQQAGWDFGQPGTPGSADLPQVPGLAALLSDGLHFSAEGYACYYKSFINKITMTWPELIEKKDDGPEPVFPLWREAMLAFRRGENITPRRVRS